MPGASTATSSSSVASSPSAVSMQTYRVSKSDGRSDQVNQQNQTFPNIKAFVDFFAEDPSKARCIKKILVATNGIAAVKCILSMRKLLMQLFKDDRIIKFICLTTEQEIQSKAEYLKMADYIVFSPAGANTSNYANVDEIVQHAVRQNVDAVWAGWGHASENPKLPEELNRNNIVFIGPPSRAMFALGDKIASTIIAQTVDIPTIEWSGSGLKAPEPTSSDVAEEMNIPEATYLEACVSTVEEGLTSLSKKKIPYPIMIKASEGGGGKGIRKCNNDEEFRLNFRRVVAEVPGSPIFLMRCMMNARHIEVQLIGDQYGNVIPIFTRDCSIQRRHQKIIEEAPAGIVPEHILRAMQQDAVNLAKKVGYVSAGTVEYMYVPAEQKYYFLELNPRLQVEHPCTEMVANINIPAIQLQIAMGIPLHRIVDIRLFFGMDRYGTTCLPEDQIRTDTNICVIAARITSEDPAEGFRPSSGSVEVLNFQSNQNVWGYFSVASTGKVHEFADSQFGHLFAKGTTRYEAISALLCALKELELRATFTSQVNYLVGLLHEEQFENNDFHTGWLDARIASKVQKMAELPLHVTIAIGATCIGHARIAEVFSKFQTSLERGQILPKSELTETWEVEMVHNNVKYSVLVNRFGAINFLVYLNGCEITTEVRELGNGTLLVTYSDQSYTCHLEEETERFKVCIGKTLTMFEKENDPSMLRSGNAGRLLQYLKKDGEHVSVGEVYAEIESMKMVITLDVKKAGGKLVHVAQPGQVLFPGTLIARLDDQDDCTAARPTTFTGRMSEWDRVQEMADTSNARLNVKFENIFQACVNIMSGYSMPEPIFRRRSKKLVDELFEILENKKLPFALFKVMLNVVETRISRMDTYEKIKKLIKVEDNFPAIALTEEMESYLSTLDPSELGIEKQYFEALLKICERFEGGLEGHMKIVFTELLENFLDTERYFQDIGDPAKVVRMVYSHTRVPAKNIFLKEIISRVADSKPSLMTSLQPTLKKISNLFNVEIEPLALYVREVLNKMHQTSYGQVCSNMTRKSSERSINDLVELASRDGGDSILRNFVSTNGEEDLVLHEFFFTSNAETNKYAIKLFIQKNFHVDESDIEVLPTHNNKSLIFKFEIRPSTPLYATHKRQRSGNTSPSSGIGSVSFTTSPSTPPPLLSPCESNNSLLSSPGSPENVVYFLSVLSELDLLKQDEMVKVLKKNSRKDANNTFLFVAYPKGENGFSNVIHLPESELKALGRSLREEVGTKLHQSGICVQGVDLMLSRPSHPPLYTQYDFSAKEKLELYRLPDGVEDVSVSASSPYLMFKHNDHDVHRIFVRSMLRDVASVLVADKYSTLSQMDLLKNKLMDVLDGACGEIRVCSAADKTSKAPYDCHHILIRLDYDPRLNTSNWWKAGEEAIRTCQKLLVKHRVSEVEIVYQESNGQPVGRQNSGIGSSAATIKLVYLNETGAIPEFSAYKVVDDRLQSISNGHARLAGESCYAQHHSIDQVLVQKKRFQASKLGTTYVYDFPLMFGQAALNLWQRFMESDPVSYKKLVSTLSRERQLALEEADGSHFVQSYEMILPSDNEEIMVCRDEAELNRRSRKGENDRGMIAWEMELYTPDAPTGRKIIVISNDITFQMGSFSMREHKLYQKASAYSRKHKMPRVYLAANSGARIGFAQDVKKKLNVVWNDSQKPEDGFQSLCVDCDNADDPVLKQIEHSKTKDGRYKIDAVIGKENDIGVENLVGSGLIAGETSAAFKEVPTYCLVTGRAVGIGAYAARLAQRICQVDTSHIILTGAPAINAVLGKEVYTSNSQLGGPQVMYKNGVSHSVVSCDLDGVCAIVKWISYLPPPKNPFSNFGMLKDDQARLVETTPTKQPYDPRTILDPVEGGGLFDHGTFDEIMSGWAKVIIAGRARLRGLPVGVVAVETRTVECELPADPATQDSQARVVFQAGQVWTPDSAYKTAEAINNFNREGLPLIVLANIRGFSGGQKDMFEMVLKFGACIVDALQSYVQPVIVYIPPFGELRGGAWAVLDTKINPTCITMLADPDSRGGVLEPNGIVEIKFRERDLHVFMSRADEKIRKLEAVVNNKEVEKAKRDQVAQEIAQRKEFLTPLFRTVATKFADLHDTTARMLAKEAIADEVSWQNARNYFYELFCVELSKMSMARGYLDAMGYNSAKISIEDLSVGYNWVNEHLAEMKVSTRKNVNPDTMEYSKRRKFVYNADEVIAYSNSSKFCSVVRQLDVQRSKDALISKLDDNSTRKAVVDDILSNSTPDARNNILLDQLKSLSATERQKLLNLLK
ncbi:carboxyl transferase domain-containing protein [Ditylenchus destructor]|uniref:Carboxyl transferase domain-containing protein n=1 Tax=Ditylenchus destructor TaxID=166010 RepID=A0AAD4N6K9_9BILA|nr:carboxyl transferase domain-containing protein [Ditylenchus destructor]